MEEYERQADQKNQTRLDIRGKCTWAEVVAEAKVAEMKYSRNAAEGPLGRIRRSFRRLQGETSGLEAILDFTPPQSVLYICVVRRFQDDIAGMTSPSIGTYLGTYLKEQPTINKQCANRMKLQGLGLRGNPPERQSTISILSDPN